MRVAVLGASGLVGREMLRILEDRGFPVDDLRLLATDRSAGERIDFREESFVVRATAGDSFEGVDLVLASAGGAASRAWLPKAVAAGAVCIDNSSAWRMDREVPLVVPEVNGAAARGHQGILANPNCSTIQMVMALQPLHEAAGLRRVIVATYQSVSGKGKAAVDALEEETAKLMNAQPFEPKVFPHQIAFNCLPDIDAPSEDGYTFEEQKMIQETRKIMGLPELGLSATCVRVPVFFGHAEAVWAELDRPLSAEEARSALNAFPGVAVIDDLEEHHYPTQILAGDRDEVFVGRIRPDRSCENGIAFWVVADNIRKGAALNAVQIAEWMIEHDLLPAGEG